MIIRIYNSYTMNGLHDFSPLYREVTVHSCVSMAHQMCVKFEVLKHVLMHALDRVAYRLYIDRKIINLLQKLTELRLVQTL